MKKLARAVLKTLARPFTCRVHARVVLWTRATTDPAFEQLQGQVTATRADVDGLIRYMPAVLNAIAAQNAMNRANVRTEEELARLVQSVLERFQTVRNELLYGRDGTRLDGVFEPKILHPDRVEAARQDLRLNLGCGQVARSGYVNVDSQPFEATDVLADPRDLPFDPRSVSEIRADRLLERFTLNEVQGALLPHWVTLLRPGGSLVVTAADADAMVRGYVSGRLSFDELRDATFGEAGDGGDIRYTMFSPASLIELLTGAGLDDVVRRNADPVTPTGEIEVAGRRPPAPSVA
jgi:hypothetical protein